MFLVLQNRTTGCLVEFFFISERVVIQAEKHQPLGVCADFSLRHATRYQLGSISQRDTGTVTRCARAKTKAVI